MDSLSEKSQRQIENIYVRSTYEAIAADFSKTRYKKWPKVAEFMSNLPVGCLVLDIGCGNGKYLDNQQTINIGCDISSNLLSICKSRGYEIINCDMTQIPFKKASFDALICIAALHHLVSRQRRLDCIRCMIDLLVEEGLLFLQVWAFEQTRDKESKYLKKDKQQNGSQSSPDRESALVEDIAIQIHKNGTQFTDQEMLVPFKSNSNKLDDNPVSLRYYHLFKEGELEDLVKNIPGLEICRSEYDSGNWYCIIKRLS